MLMFKAQRSYRIRVIGGGLGFDVTAEPEVGDFLRLESVVEAAEGVPVDKDLEGNFKFKQFCDENIQMMCQRNLQKGFLKSNYGDKLIKLDLFKH